MTDERIVERAGPRLSVLGYTHAAWCKDCGSTLGAIFAETDAEAAVQAAAMACDHLVEPPEPERRCSEMIAVPDEADDMGGLLRAKWIKCGAPITMGELCADCAARDRPGTMAGLFESNDRTWDRAMRARRED
jgi:hypothetical protein